MPDLHAQSCLPEPRRMHADGIGRTIVDFIIRHQAGGLAASKTLRRLARAVLEQHDGCLNDDATVVLCDARRQPPGLARAVSGEVGR
ncbi:hypothetical protein [Streptomyces chryseus]|uniref:hypothetical protein n=1 Tax=Streptomyces chryseus TaxID=68186 RepID=UPI001E3D774E|nr:hypothetical protein [Streptomyces chryseus]